VTDPYDTSPPTEDFAVIEPDPPVDTGTFVEAKLTVASLVTLAASIGAALLNALQGDSALLGSLPPWAQFVLIAAIPPLLAFTSGYLKTSNRTG